MIRNLNCIQTVEVALSQIQFDPVEKFESHQKRKWKKFFGKGKGGKVCVRLLLLLECKNKLDGNRIN